MDRAAPDSDVLKRRLARERKARLESEAIAEKATSALYETIQALEQLQERLAQQALHDPLTGLANRTLLLDRLEQALARSHRDRTKVGVLYLDLDRFKAVNDHQGHAAGDSLLRAIAGRLTGVVRASDTLGRLGGDEFLLVCDPLTEDSEAVPLARRIGIMFSQPFQLGESEVSIGVSIGVAVSRETTSGDELIRRADEAMYLAKQSGRGRYEVFQEGPGAEPPDWQDARRTPQAITPNE